MRDWGMVDVDLRVRTEKGIWRGECGLHYSRLCEMHIATQDFTSPGKNHLVRG